MTTVKAPRRAGVYARISRDDGQALGVKRQEADCRTLCERRGWEVVDAYQDNDRSAYDGTARPEFDRLVADLRSRRVDAIAVWHPDRLTRSPRELEDLVDLIETCGAAVATVTAGDYDLATPTGRMTARIVGATARQESEHKAERIKRKKDELAERGRPGGGSRRFGYRPGNMEIDEDEAAELCDAAKRVLAGETLTAIATDWNARAVLPPQKGKAWTVGGIKRVLTRPSQAGLRVHRGEVVGEAAWPAVLDRATHERLRALLLDPNRAHRPNRPHLLTGIARCAECGARLVRNGGGNKSYTVWRCYPIPGREGCGKVNVSAARLEELVTEALLLRLDTPALAKALRAPRADHDDDEAIATIADVDARLDELATMYADGEISRAELLTARRRLTERRENAQRHLAATTSSDALAEFAEPGALRAAWPTLDIDRQRAVLAAVVDEVRVRSAQRRGRIFDPNRVDISWRV
ncbi:MAG: recombinase family protein [Acidimicrobiia bacterium]